jgi:methyltransferase
VTGPASLPWLALAVGLLVLQRLAELALARRNARRALALGAVEHAAGQLRWFVALHALFPVALVAEVLAFGARPGPAWPLWLGAYLAAQALRYASIRALGPAWNVRVLVRPGVAPVRRGPYRWLRHPNYLAVVVELAALPLLGGDAPREQDQVGDRGRERRAPGAEQERALGLREGPSPAVPAATVLPETVATA